MLYNLCFMLRPLYVGVCVWSLFCNIIILFFLSSLVFHLSEGRVLLSLNCFFFNMCVCFVYVLLCLPQGETCWYKIRNCGII